MGVIHNARIVPVIPELHCEYTHDNHGTMSNLVLAHQQTTCPCACGTSPNAARRNTANRQKLPFLVRYWSVPRTQHSLDMAWLKCKQEDLREKKVGQSWIPHHAPHTTTSRCISSQKATGGHGQAPYGITRCR